MRTRFSRRTLCALLWCACLCGLTARATAGPGAASTVARIERVPVESSSLVSIGFARDAHVLEIEFRSGAIYRYLGVPATVFEGLKKAESKGRYFAQFIRGKYEFQHLEVPAK